MTVLLGLLRNRIVWTAAAAGGFYWLLAFYIESNALIGFVRALLLTSAVAVAIAYSRPVVRALSHHEYDRVIHLTLGITLSWFASMLMSLWALTWRIAGFPPWMMQSDLVGFFIWLQVLAAVLHLTAPNSIDGRVPTKARLQVAFVVGLAVLLVMMLAAMEPNLRGMLSDASIGLD